MNQCIPEISVDTRMIIAKLQECKIGEIITYEDLDKTIGRKTPPGILNTARKRVLSDNQIVFGTIRKVGFKRLSDSEIVDNSASTFNSIQRATKRERKKLISVDFENLSSSSKIKHSATAATLAVINEIAKPKEQLKLESKISTNANQKLSMIQALEAFKGIIETA